MISHVFGLVGEYISLLLTNQHLEEEPPIVEEFLIPAPASEAFRALAKTVGMFWFQWL